MDGSRRKVRTYSRQHIISESESMATHTRYCVPMTEKHMVSQHGRRWWMSHCSLSFNNTWNSVTESNETQLELPSLRIYLASEIIRQSCDVSCPDTLTLECYEGSERPAINSTLHAEVSSGPLPPFSYVQSWQHKYFFLYIFSSVPADVPYIISTSWMWRNRRRVSDFHVDNETYMFLPLASPEKLLSSSIDINRKERRWGDRVTLRYTVQ